MYCTYRYEISLCICVATDKNCLLNETCTQITFSITHREGLSLGKFPCATSQFLRKRSDWLQSHAFASRCVKLLNWKTVVAKLVTDTSTCISLS